MRYLDLEIQNVGPLKIANDDTSQQGQTDTLYYIPGSTIRGLVIHSLCKDERFEKMKKDVFSDKVHFMNAYLKAGDKRMIPSLKGFYEDKAICKGKKEIENVLIKDIGQGMKRASLGRYCCLDGENILYCGVAMGENLNINRGREGKKTVFRSQYIQKGQSFAGYITFDDSVEDETITVIREVFSDCFYIGNSRYSGYGKCRCVKAELEIGIPYGELRNRRDRSQFYMVLLSNMSMRNAYGELVGLDLDILANRLSCSSLRLNRCASSVVEVHGYNRSWDGAIPSSMMYEAGSVFCVETEDGSEVGAEHFAKLEEQGIGIRRNEGFGQVLFLDMYDQLRYKIPIDKKGSAEHAVCLSDKQGTDAGKDGVKCIGGQQDAFYGHKAEVEMDMRIAARGLMVHRLERAMEKYLVDHPLRLPGISNTKQGIVLSICMELRYSPKEAEEKLIEFVTHSQKKDDRYKNHDGKQKQDALYEYVYAVLKGDLLKEMNLYQKDKKILGVPVSEILDEEELISYKLKLMIRQIRYTNRGVKAYAD